MIPCHELTSDLCRVDLYATATDRVCSIAEASLLIDDGNMLDMLDMMEMMEEMDMVEETDTVEEVETTINSTSTCDLGPISDPANSLSWMHIGSCE